MLVAFEYENRLQSCRENHKRISQWGSQPGKQCVISYDGAAFRSLQASNFEGKDFDFAQRHLRIISGMYGLLRPLDMIQPYRSKAECVSEGKTLCDFVRICKHLAILGIRPDSYNAKPHKDFRRRL